MNSTHIFVLEVFYFAVNIYKEKWKSASGNGTERRHIFHVECHVKVYVYFKVSFVLAPPHN